MYRHLGDCHNIAVAFSQELLVPICLLYGLRELPGEGREHVMIHAGVIYKGLFLDEKGLNDSPESLLLDLIERNPEYVATKILYFDSSEDLDFIKILSLTGARLSADKIESFKESIVKPLIVSHS